MAQGVQLPDGSYIALQKEETAEQAWGRALQKYPEAFGFPQAAPNEDTTGFGAAASAGASRMYGEGALTLGKMGVLDTKRAEDIHKEQQKKAEARFTPTKEGWLDAPWQNFKETAGGSLPYMAAPLAVGAGAALGAPLLGIGAAGAGALATGLGGAASVAQFTGSNLAAGMEEGKKGLEDTSGLAAFGTAIPQAALDMLSLRMVPGLGKLFGSVGQQLTRAEAREMANQTLKQAALDYTKATGKTMGIEGVTETAQQVLERAQAGADLTDDKARKEYADNFIGGAALALAMGPFGRFAERSHSKNLGEKVKARDEKVAGWAQQREDTARRAASGEVADQNAADYDDEQRDLMAQMGASHDTTLPDVTSQLQYQDQQQRSARATQAQNLFAGMESPSDIGQLPSPHMRASTSHTPDTTQLQRELHAANNELAQLEPDGSSFAKEWTIQAHIQDLQEQIDSAAIPQGEQTRDRWAQESLPPVSELQRSIDALTKHKAQLDATYTSAPEDQKLQLGQALFPQAQRIEQTLEQLQQQLVTAQKLAPAQTDELVTARKELVAANQGSSLAAKIAAANKVHALESGQAPALFEERAGQTFPSQGNQAYAANDALAAQQQALADSIASPISVADTAPKAGEDLYTSLAGVGDAQRQQAVARGQQELEGQNANRRQQINTWADEGRILAEPTTNTQVQQEIARLRAIGSTPEVIEQYRQRITRERQQRQQELQRVKQGDLAVAGQNNLFGGKAYETDHIGSETRDTPKMLQAFVAKVANKPGLDADTQALVQQVQEHLPQIAQSSQRTEQSHIATVRGVPKLTDVNVSPLRDTIDWLRRVDSGHATEQDARPIQALIADMRQARTSETPQTATPARILNTPEQQELLDGTDPRYKPLPTTQAQRPVHLANRVSDAEDKAPRAPTGDFESDTRDPGVPPYVQPDMFEDGPLRGTIFDSPEALQAHLGSEALHEERQNKGVSTPETAAHVMQRIAPMQQGLSAIQKYLSALIAARDAAKKRGAGFSAPLQRKIEGLDYALKERLHAFNNGAGILQRVLLDAWHPVHLAQKEADALATKLQEHSAELEAKISAAEHGDEEHTALVKHRVDAAQSYTDALDAYKSAVANNESTLPALRMLTTARDELSTTGGEWVTRQSDKLFEDFLIKNAELADAEVALKHKTRGLKGAYTQVQKTVAGLDAFPEYQAAAEHVAQVARTLKEHESRLARVQQYTQKKTAPFAPAITEASLAAAPVGDAVRAAHAQIRQMQEARTQSARHAEEARMNRTKTGEVNTQREEAQQRNEALERVRGQTPGLKVEFARTEGGASAHGAFDELEHLRDRRDFSYKEKNGVEYKVAAQQWLTTAYEGALKRLQERYGKDAVDNISRLQIELRKKSIPDSTRTRMEHHLEDLIDALSASQTLEKPVVKRDLGAIETLVNGRDKSDGKRVRGLRELKQRITELNKILGASQDADLFAPAQEAEMQKLYQEGVLLQKRQVAGDKLTKKEQTALSTYEAQRAKLVAKRRAVLERERATVQALYDRQYQSMSALMSRLQGHMGVKTTPIYTEAQKLMASVGPVTPQTAKQETATAHIAETQSDRHQAAPFSRKAVTVAARTRTGDTRRTENSSSSPRNPMVQSKAAPGAKPVTGAIEAANEEATELTGKKAEERIAEDTEKTKKAEAALDVIEARRLGELAVSDTAKEHTDLRERMIRFLTVSGWTRNDLSTFPDSDLHKEVARIKNKKGRQQGTASSAKEIRALTKGAKVTEQKESEETAEDWAEETAEAKDTALREAYATPQSLAYTTLQSLAPANARRSFVRSVMGLVTGALLPHQQAFAADLSSVMRKGDLDGALNKIAAESSNPAFRMLAKQLLRLGTANISLKVIEPGKTYKEGIPGSLNSAYGVAQLDRKRGKVAIFIRGDIGMRESTLLHEMIHAVLMARYDEISYYVANSSLQGRSADPTLKLFAEVWREFSDAAKKTYPTKEARADAPVGVREAMRSPDEFITHALTDPELQDWMRKQKYEGLTLWGKFKEFVQGFLGFGKTEPTWLDAALRVSNDVLSAAEKDTPDFKTSQKLLAKMGGSVEAHSALPSTMSEHIAATMRGVFPGTAPKAAAGISKSTQALVGRTVARQATIGDKIAAYGMGLRVRVTSFDRYAAIAALVKQGVGAGIKDKNDKTRKLDEIVGMQTLAHLRLHENRTQLSQTALIDGFPQLSAPDAKGLRVIEGRGGANALQISAALAKAGVGNQQFTEQMFTAWMALKRNASALNFDTPPTAQERSALQADLNAHPNAEAAFEEARKLYKQFNTDALKLLMDSGVIDKHAFNEWLAGDYIPFYRVEDGIVRLHIGGSRPFNIGSIIDQPDLKELIGGNDKILPFFSGIVQNTSLIMRTALTNMQTKDVANVLKTLGLGTIIPGQAPPGEYVISFKAPDASGKTGEYWLKLDESAFPPDIPADLIIQGMQGIKTAVPALVKLMGRPAQWLRAGITKMPVYALRQAIRDPVHAYMTTGGDFSKIMGSFKEFGSMVAGKNQTELTLKRAGVISSNVYSSNPEDVAHMLRRMSLGEHGWQGAMVKLEELALKGDAATRAALYNMYRAKGMSHVEALLGAAEAMNFSRRGTSASLHWVSTMVPFFNAQLQGLDATYRAFKGDTIFENRMQARTALYKRGMLLVGMTTAYALMMQDDDTYKNATPEERAMNFFVRVPGVSEAIRVPIPFEMGLVFKALAEAMVAAAFTDMKAKDAMKGLKGALLQQNPLSLPTAVKGALEIAANYSFYSNTPIESEHDKALKVSERVRPGTTEFAKVIGMAGVLSPIQIDYLVRSYFGGMGVLATTIPNIILRPFSSHAEGPESLPHENPVYGSLFQPVNGRGIINAVFDEVVDYQQAATTYKHLISEGRTKEAMAFASKYATDIAMASTGGKYKEQMGEFANLKRMIAADPIMPPTTKRAQIEMIKKQEIQFATIVRSLAH